MKIRSSCALGLLALAICCAPAFASGAALPCPTQYALTDYFFTPKERDQIQELKNRAMESEASPRKRKRAEEELLSWMQKKLKELGFKTRRQTILNEETDSGKENFLVVLEAPDKYPVGKVIRRVKERFGMQVGLNPRDLS